MSTVRQSLFLDREIDNMRLCLQATHKLWERQIIDKESDVLEEMEARVESLKKESYIT